MPTGDVASPNLAAEAVVAVTGLWQDDAVSSADARVAGALPKAWRSAIVDFLDRDRPRAFTLPKTPDHLTIASRLDDGLSSERSGKLVSKMSDSAIAEAYVTVVARALKFLQGMWPVSSVDTPVGPRRVAPGDVAMGKAAAVLSVVDDPDRVIDEVRSWTLTDDQAAAFKACYPSLYDMLRAIIWAELTRRFPTADKYDLSFDRERVIRTLVGLPPSVDLASAAPASPPKAPPKVSVDTKGGLATKAQELAQR